MRIRMKRPSHVYVIADSKERENMIREQIKAIEAEQGVQVQIEEGLLNEVLNLVEYPTAFMGSFDTKYLDVPEEVLVTSMETHQRYFVVRDLDGKLKPNFISVRNGNAEHLENVIRGNEKSWWHVLKMVNFSGVKTKT